MYCNVREDGAGRGGWSRGWRLVSIKEASNRSLLRSFLCKYPPGGMGVEGQRLRVEDEDLGGRAEGFQSMCNTVPTAQG